MNPDQTALQEQSDLGPYCLQYILQNISADDIADDVSKMPRKGLKGFIGN